MRPAPPSAPTDLEIFTGGIALDGATLPFEELAYLNGGVRIVFRDERESARDERGTPMRRPHFYEGIKEYVAT